MAYRIQITAPDVMNINNEPEYIHEMYGIKPGRACFANNVLLARKLVEKGVRFIQLFDCFNELKIPFSDLHKILFANGKKP